MKKLIFIITNIFAPLFSGLFIYLFFRSSNFRFIDFSKNRELLSTIYEIRKSLIPLSQNLPDFLIYNLPDGFIVYAAASSIFLIWHNQSKQWLFFWLTIVGIFSILYEFLQLTGIAAGTFDIKDIFFIILFFIFSLINMRKYNETPETVFL